MDNMTVMANGTGYCRYLKRKEDCDKCEYTPPTNIDACRDYNKRTQEKITLRVNE